MQDRKLQSIISSFKTQNNRNIWNTLFHNTGNMSICQKCRTGGFPALHTFGGLKLNVLSVSMCGSGTKTRLRSQPGWVLSSSSRPHFLLQPCPSPALRPTPATPAVTGLQRGRKQRSQCSAVPRRPEVETSQLWLSPHFPHHSLNITFSTSRKIGFK